MKAELERLHARWDGLAREMAVIQALLVRVTQAGQEVTQLVREISSN